MRFSLVYLFRVTAGVVGLLISRDFSCCHVNIEQYSMRFNDSLCDRHSFKINHHKVDLKVAKIATMLLGRPEFYSLT